MFVPAGYFEKSMRNSYRSAPACRYSTTGWVLGIRPPSVATMTIGAPLLSRSRSDREIEALRTRNR